MLSCWNIKPDGRPHFKSLKNTLENILLHSKDYFELDIGDDENACSRTITLQDKDIDDEASMRTTK
jgi:hypothetical protein